MQRADSRIHAAFETRAKELADRLRDERGIATRTRVIILEQLRRGNANMPAVAKTMGHERRDPSPTARRRRHHA